MLGGCRTSESDFKSGLLGVFYSNADFIGAKLLSVLESGEQHWGAQDGLASEWSAEWSGYLISPDDGRLSLYLQTDQSARLILQTDTVECQQEEKAVTLQVQKGKRYPLTVGYSHARGGEGWLRLSWSYPGQEKIGIPAGSFVHGEGQRSRWYWLFEPEADTTRFQFVEGENIVVVHHPDFFHGWPANNGLWSWGDEIVVGLIRSPYRYDRLHHSFQKTQQTALLARSTDGGRSWTIEDPEHFVRDGGVPRSLQRPIDFSHPLLAIRVERDGFYYSYDRGKTWQGPSLFNGLDMGELTSRTDYLPLDRNRCLFFLSCVDNRVKANLPDRAFCARTDDGGRSFQFLSWMTETDTIRSVMPSTIRIGEGHLLSALRRRYDPPGSGRFRPQQNWIDVYQSLDNGASWTFLSKVADTDNGTWNGNPPTLVQLRDGRLCVLYGCRAVPVGIRARLSADGGKTWGKEIILRSDALSKDIGYTRAAVRPDGNVVTLYYFTTQEHKQQHIAATIWDPSRIPSNL